MAAPAAPAPPRGDLNARLVRALNDPESREVPRLIRAGADVRTRGQDGYTALMWAANRKDYPLVREILERGGPACAAREVPALPQRGGASTAYALEELERALTATLRKHGRSVPLLAGLGNVRFRLGRYRQAEQAFQAASERHSIPEVKSGLARTREVLKTLSKVRPHLPREHNEVRAVRLRNPGGAVWAVVSARRSETEQAVGLPLSAPELRAFTQEGRRFRPVGRPVPVADPRRPRDRFSRLTLYAGDLTRDGGDEVAVETLMQGASWTPTHLSVFVIRKGGLARVLRAVSSEPLWIQDLNRDGNCEVGNYYEIGDSLSHAEQPRWSDIYAYRDGRYEVANRLFPKEFAHWPRELAEVLKQHPNEAEVARHLGQAYEILKQPSRALTAYYQASGAYQERLKEETDSVYRAALRKRMVETQRRIRALRSAL